MLAKNKSAQVLSPPVRFIPQPFILPLAKHLSIFVQIIHRLITQGRIQDVLIGGLNLLGGRGGGEGSIC